MPNVAARRSDVFSIKIFALGLLVVALLYGALFAVLYLLQNRTFDDLESRLARRTVPLEQLALKPAADNNSAEEDQSGVVRSADALKDAPFTGLTEEHEVGLLPVISKQDGLTPFEAYRRPFAGELKAPYVAIGITDYGLSAGMSSAVLTSLPPEVSLILSPYAPDPELMQKTARADGHELWLQLMTETKHFPQTDPGSQALMTRVSLRYNRERLLWTLARTTGYTGIASFTDQALNSAVASVEPLINDVFLRGLGVFELNPANDESFMLPRAAKALAPMTKNLQHFDLFHIEAPPVQELDTHIKDFGHAVITVTPTPTNIGALKLWIDMVKSKGVAVVPLSAVAANPAPAASPASSVAPATAAPATP